MKPYPKWTCIPCGKEHGTRQQAVSCWHYGKCDVCETNTEVTEPRDFGHFNKWFEKKKK